MIPELIDDTELIIRVILYPKMLTKKDKIRSVAFRSQSDKDEVSTIRLEYCSADFCKKHGKSIQNPEKDKSYIGLAALKAIEIRQIEADVVSSPEHFPVHSDIKIGYIAKKGEQLPAEYKYKVDQLASTARFYNDNNIESDRWEGNDPI